MEEKNRRVSTPAFKLDQEPFHNFRSLRTARHHITKQPEVSVIVEVETDQEYADAEENNFPRATLSARPASMNNLKISENYEMYGRSISRNHSRRSTSSVISNVSGRSIDLTQVKKSSKNDNGSGGNINQGYQNSNINLHRSTSSLRSNATAPVVREQYFCCRKWTRREKILAIVVVSLIGLIFGLFIVIGIIAHRNTDDDVDDFIPVVRKL